jgi:hypothetical protein
MNRRHPKRFMTGKHFAQIPDEVLTSDAFRTLPNYAVRVLLAIAAQYRGNNNGDLAMTWAMGAPYGITSKKHLVASLADLLNRGLIAKTRQGGKKPMGPTLYAVTWQPINDLAGKIASGATTTAANTWARWREPATAAATDQDGKVHRDPRGTLSAPQGDQTEPVSGLPGDQRNQFIGTPGSPPSRSWREGRRIRALAEGQS